MHIETNTRTTKQEMIVRIKEQYVGICCGIR